MTSSDLPPKTAALFADLYLERLSGEKICAWALAALEAGFDTEGLRVLAGMSLEKLPHFSEVQPYLVTTLDELGVAVPPNKEQALRSYARSVAEELATDRIAVEAALHEIHAAVVTPLNHPADLMGWCYLWEGNLPDGSAADLPEADFERVARDFAKIWLANGKDITG